MATKTCKQCGEIKPLDQFRPYYGGRKGTYRTCKLCEKINSREKYLLNKSSSGTISADEVEELEKIHDLWEAQVQLGLQPPRFIAVKTTPLTESLDSMLARYTAASKQVIIADTSAPPQPELIKWLSEPLTKEPEYYQDDVYEDLKSRYRPMIRVDKDTMLPVYDDTYKEILRQIAARFDEYEDSYYGKDE